MIKLGTRKIQRISFIATDKELDVVQRWLKKTGYHPTQNDPVHKITLRRAEKKHLARIKNPLEIIKGMRLITAERPLKGV